MNLVNIRKEILYPQIQGVTYDMRCGSQFRMHGVQRPWHGWVDPGATLAEGA
jgi:hypothetical protein